MSIAVLLLACHLRQPPVITYRLRVPGRIVRTPPDNEIWSGTFYIGDVLPGQSFTIGIPIHIPQPVTTSIQPAEKK